MMPEDFLFPYLARFFEHYLGELSITSAEAYDRGPAEFTSWLRSQLPPVETFPDAKEKAYETESDWEEEEEEGGGGEIDSDDVEPAQIIRHLISDPNSAWIFPYWGRLITSFRKAPTHPIVELYAAFVVRWGDGHVFPFMCVVPEELVRPEGAINDQLLVHIVDVFSTQFAELLTSRSADDLYKLQSGLISKDSIKKVLRLARKEVLKAPEEERPTLRRALRFLRTVSLPTLPPEAFRKAAKNLLPNLELNTDWRIFPIGEEDE